MKRNYWLDNGTGGPMHGKYFEDYHIALELADDVGAMVRTGPDQASFYHLISEAKQMRDNHPDWRYGQCMFNALYLIAPDIANIVRTTKAYPFHDDTRINAMIQRFFKERG